VVAGCVEKDAFNSHLGALEDSLKATVDVQQKQQNEISTQAERIDRVENNVEQSIKMVQDVTAGRDSIIYSGAGWVVAGAGVVALLFLGAGVAMFYLVLQRTKLLNLVTTAVSKATPEAQVSVKDNVKLLASDGLTKVLKGYLTKRGTEV
jgi:hypothetical protein